MRRGVASKTVHSIPEDRTGSECKPESLEHGIWRFLQNLDEQTEELKLLQICLELANLMLQPYLSGFLEQEGGADAWPANGAAILSLKWGGVEGAALWEVDIKAVLGHKEVECAVEVQTVQGGGGCLSWDSGQAELRERLPKHTCEEGTWV
ncbi:hypothetical protein EOD39_16994 [Acipenser ruthenus]|uniref:Uncharacterized protein n=1 Tax=Acipenser ruthenus TaxID=7906 RepID=A0A444V4I9_ACIRT|nr:hypothetical protein EOD39_16994 [Acipenser ruthenus]